MSKIITIYIILYYILNYICMYVYIVIMPTRTEGMKLRWKKKGRKSNNAAVSSFFLYFLFSFNNLFIYYFLFTIKPYN